MKEFDYDDYLDRQIEKHIRDDSDDEAYYDAHQDALCDKADSDRELEREE